MSQRLFTPRFFIMFGYSFTVFVSVFQLLPTAPYRVLAIGGSTAVAGLFHGFLTFSSATSAPFAGPISDRLGHRRVLITVSLLLTMITASYAVVSDYRVMLGMVLVHGLIWSALLSASGAYMTATIPQSRRGEGLGYWGLASVLAIGAAPAVGFWVYHQGWVALCLELACLNLLMAAIAWFLPDDEVSARPQRANTRHAAAAETWQGGVASLVRSHVEWRVVWLSMATSLVSFGYGALTSFSALFADELGISPRSLFLTVMAGATVIGRLTVGRTLDAAGPRRVLVRCMAAPPLGLLLLSMATTTPMIVVSALVFGAGFGLLLPSYNTYVLTHVHASKRGAAFGAMLAAFDSGIGAGSSAMGWLVHAHGFRVGFTVAAVLSALALPYFLMAERKLGFAELRPGTVSS